MVVGDLQLLGRTQHAVTFHTAQLADLDLEGLTVFTRRQLGADGGARHLDTHAGVGRTADDVQQRGATYIHLAHAQAISVRMLHGLLDLADHDAAEGRRHRLGLFHFQTGHGQHVGQLRRGDCWVAEFTQPGFRELHSQILGPSRRMAFSS